MIAGIVHQGSGLGNQLHRYVATRVLALDKGYKWTMVEPGNFKGASFMDIDMGHRCQFATHTEIPSGKVVVESSFPLWDEKTNYYNPEFNFIEDNTIIDGEFQDPRYFEHRLPEIREWLKVEPIKMPDDVCVINFRGGEYTMFPDLFLTKEYWDEALKLMPIGLKYEVHTDDPETAKQFFPDYPIIHDIGLNWRSIRYAKYLILSNSSFAILPALLNENVKLVVAPRYWARRNTKTWCQPSNYYKQFTYV